MIRVICGVKTRTGTELHLCNIDFSVQCKTVSDSRIKIGAMMAPPIKKIQPNEEKKKKKKDTKAKTKKGFADYNEAQKKVSGHYYFLKTIQYS